MLEVSSRPHESKDSPDFLSVLWVTIRQAPSMKRCYEGQRFIQAERLKLAFVRCLKHNSEPCVKMCSSCEGLADLVSICSRHSQRNGIRNSPSHATSYE